LSADKVASIQQTFELFCAGGLHFLAVSRTAFRNGTQLIPNLSGLRAGDALHLALALEANVSEFATLDKLLAEKAQSMNLSLTQF
jgi:predicted nucleic acid-binding protein